MTTRALLALALVAGPVALAGEEAKLEKAELPASRR